MVTVPTGADHVGDVVLPVIVEADDMVDLHMAVAKFASTVGAPSSSFPIDEFSCRSGYGVSFHRIPFTSYMKSDKKSDF